MQNPMETRLEVYVEKAEAHEVASGHKDLREALQEHEEDHPHWLRGHQKKWLQGITKAAHLDLVATAKKR